MGEGEESSAETKANHFSSRQKENRGGCTGEVGEAQGGEEEGGVEPNSSEMLGPVMVFIPTLAQF